MKIATATDRGWVPNEKYQLLLFTYIYKAIAVRTGILKNMKKNDSFDLKKVIGIFLILFSENDVFFNDIIYETRLNYLQFKTNPSSKG